jgi:hypothetical protein
MPAEIVTDEINGAYPGHLACEYLNTGTKAAPVYVRIQRIEDVDHPDERATSEFQHKGTDFVKYLRGKRATSVSFVYKLKRAADPVFAALEEAYSDINKCVHYFATDRPIAEDGAKGFSGPYVVTKLGEKRPFGDAVGVEVELKLADANLDDGTPWEREPHLTEAA